VNLHGKFSPYPYVISRVWSIKVVDIVGMRDVMDTAGVETQLSHHFVTIDTRYGKDGISVFPSPSAIVAQIPNYRIHILRLVARVIGLIKNEGADKVKSRRCKICLGAFAAEPRGESNEVEVGRGQVALTSHVARYEVVLLCIA
jgi:hypothetical protein